MRKIGIGYTIFEWQGDHKIPIDMVKGKPGNLFNEVARLQKRMKKLASQNRKGIELCTWMFLYGFTFRIALAV